MRLLLFITLGAASADLNYTAFGLSNCSDAGVTLSLVDSAACIEIPASFSALAPTLAGFYIGTTPNPSGSPTANLICSGTTQEGCDAAVAKQTTAGTNTGGCSYVHSDGVCEYSLNSQVTYKGVLYAGETTSTPCFPSSAMVTMADGHASRLDQLKEGDAIVAATVHGAVRVDTVSLLSIAKPDAESKFISLTTNSGRALNLTADHHLPIGPTCCAELKKASDVSVADTIWVASKTGVVAHKVAKLTTTVAKGLHSPVLTHGSFPIVDGVVTSFDSIGKVTLAAYGLPALLKACRLTGTCHLLRSI